MAGWACRCRLATTVRLLHHGLPPDVVEDHERGWAYFLGALRDTLTAG